MTFGAMFVAPPQKSGGIAKNFDPPGSYAKQECAAMGEILTYLLT